MSTHPLKPGQILSGALFHEPMRVVTVIEAGDGAVQVGLVGAKSEKYRNVTLSAADIQTLSIIDTAFSFDGDGNLIRVGLQAYALGLSWEYDPYFGLSISRVDPLPHQLEAVYDYLLKLARVRFLLADDAGAGKTIMAGLLIKELELRGLAERILIVCPANLAFQWQRELKEKFEETFLVMKGHDVREQFGVNQWLEQKRVITSLDLAKRYEMLPGLRQVHWDLVIVDEAHRLSWSPPARKTARYALGELLRDSSDHLLLLTATPHKGNPDNFTLFLQLLDQDAYADVKSIKQAMERRRAPFYLRRTKEAMVYFPERTPDGTWVAKKIFTKRIPHTVDFKIAGDELDLYREVTKFVKRQSAKAAAREEDARARAVGFLMSLYQRRLSSSARALRRSLENRAVRLEQSLKKAQAIAQMAPEDLPDPDELEEMEEGERERIEEIISAFTLSSNRDQVMEEVAELRELAEKAESIEARNVEAKLSRLKDLLEKQGFFSDSSKRLLIFSEFRDTLNYLVEKLREWGLSVGSIHGQMKPGSRDEPGTRLHSEQQFKDGAIQVLVATEAAGEGINLQVCNVLFNYDIPWNPNRLEQRMGRIHRYGQKKDCLIFNFVATNTVEGRVLQKLLEKLQEIRDALDDDAVFNVVGEILPAAQVERVFRDYYAGKLGKEDLEERLLRDVDEGQFRSICQNALEGLASKKLNLNMLVERRARAQERRVVPETIARFIKEAAKLVPLPLKLVDALPHAFEPGKTPTILKKYEQEPDWKLQQIAQKYPRCSTDRETAEKNNLEWVTPGHPLFEAIRRCVHEKAQPVLGKGATFYSLQHESPCRLDFYRARVVDGLGHTIHEKLFAVEVCEGGDSILREPGILGNLEPTNTPTVLPECAMQEPQIGWLQQAALESFLQETRDERLGEIDRIADHVELSLTELIQKADEEIGKLQSAIENKEQGAEGRLAQAETRCAELVARRSKRREELQREKAITLQGVDRISSILILPHPERTSPEVSRLKQDKETEAIAMRVAMEHERNEGRQVEDVHEKNLGYDITSIDLSTGELRLIEVKGLGAKTGNILLTPNERRVAEDRRDCYWLYAVTNCDGEPKLEEVRDPAKFSWREVQKVLHYTLTVNTLTEPMTVKEPSPPYGGEK